MSKELEIWLAISFGAFFRILASSKATGEPKAPISRFGVLDTLTSTFVEQRLLQTSSRDEVKTLLISWRGS